MDKRVFCVVVLWVFLCGCGARTAAMRGQGFVELTTPDIVLRTDLEMPKARQLVKDIQSIRSYFAESLFPCSEGVSLPATRVTVFSHSRDVDALRGENVAGYFQRAPVSWLSAEVVIGVGRRSAAPLEIFAHELTHQMVSLCYPRAPAWLNEGLAEVFQTLRPMGADRMAIGRPSYAFGTRFGTVHMGRGPERQKIIVVPGSGVLDLSELRGMSRSQFYVSDEAGDTQLRQVTLNYAGAWAAVHMLQFGEPELHGRFQAYLQDLRRSREPSEGLWERHFAGVDVDVDERVRAYRRRGEFGWMHTERPEGASNPRERVMDAAEAHLHLAELFIRAGKPEESKAHLVLAEAAGATHATLELFRGTVAWVQGDQAVALRHIRNAADDPTLHPAAQAHVGISLSRGLHGEALDASLARLRENATSAEDFAVLARAALLEGRVEEALALAERSIEINRLCSMCQEVLGHCLLVSGAPPRAVESLEAALLSSGHEVDPRRASLETLLAGARRALAAERAEGDVAGDLSVVVELEPKVADDLNAMAEPCSAALLEQNPLAEGEVEVSMHIAPSGVVRRAQVERSSLGEPAAERCVASLVRGWLFAQPNWSGEVTTRHTFVFGGE